MNRILIAATATNLCAMVCAQFGTVAPEDPNLLKWHEQSEERKQLILRAVDMVIQHPDATPEDSHAGWLEQQLADGWTHGEKADSEAKTHPNLVPWPELPVEMRIRDSLLHLVVNELKGLPDAPAAGAMDVIRVASVPRITALPGSNVAVKYIGVRETYRDGTFGTHLVFQKGETKWVPAEKAALMFQHPSVYVPGDPKELQPPVATQEAKAAVKQPLPDDLAKEQAVQEARDSIQNMDKAGLAAFIKVHFNQEIDNRLGVQKLRDQATMLLDQYGLAQ